MVALVVLTWQVTNLELLTLNLVFFVKKNEIRPVLTMWFFFTKNAKYYKSGAKLVTSTGISKPLVVPAA